MKYEEENRKLEENKIRKKRDKHTNRKKEIICKDNMKIILEKLNL